MTTTNTITVSLADSTTDETASADYFQVEDGWIIFKTQAGKAVVAYPEKRVTKIKVEASEPQVTMNFSGVAVDADSAREAARKASRWAHRL